MPHAAGLWYEVSGHDDGPSLILSPGLGGSAAYWTPNLEALAEDHRLILYDHRGTGRSDRALQPDLTVDDMADVAFNHIFLTDWTHYPAMNAVYAEYFPGAKPARYCIQCGLVKPGLLVEIASVAHIG